MIRGVMVTAMLAIGMRKPGILGTLQLAGVLVFAAPLIFFGADWLLQGRVLGAVFMLLGIVMLVLERYLTNPFSAGDIIETVLERVTSDDE